MFELQGNVQINSNWKVAVITSRFNDEVTSRLKQGCLGEMEKLGFKSNQVTSISVPGAYEIPLAARQCIEMGYDGVIALGAVIRGETSHYDYVCNAVERGCSELQIRTGQPVVFGVLTTENEAQAFDRIGGQHGHKGVESAQVLVEMLNLKNLIQPPKEDENVPKN